MFQLDDQFLKDMGVDQLPDDQKKAFLEHVYSQLELRVGTRLSEGLSEQQLTEFESFVDRDDEKVRSWIAANAPDYTNDPTYSQIREKATENLPESVILAEYASLKWLSKNRPDYRTVVQQVLDEIKREILDNRDAILAA